MISIYLVWILLLYFVRCYFFLSSSIVCVYARHRWRRCRGKCLLSLFLPLQDGSSSGNRRQLDDFRFAFLQKVAFVSKTLERFRIHRYIDDFHQRESFTINRKYVNREEESQDILSKKSERRVTQSSFMIVFNVFCLSSFKTISGCVCPLYTMQCIRFTLIKQLNNWCNITNESVATEFGCSMLHAM